ncbi:MAG: NADH-quinone oxidoreductase subunit H, partial [Candidatus Aminicenantales bacterium]
MFELAFLFLVPAISLFFEGIRRKLIARTQNRIGPPVWQPFYDVVKLWNKKPSNSLGYTNIFFRLSPILYTISAFTLFLFIPFSFVAFQYDFILLIYITI